MAGPQSILLDVGHDPITSIDMFVEARCLDVETVSEIAHREGVEARLHHQEKSFVEEAFPRWAGGVSHSTVRLTVLAEGDEHVWARSGSTSTHLER